jgi:hypothetical protein
MDQAIHRFSSELEWQDTLQWICTKMCSGSTMRSPVQELELIFTGSHRPIVFHSSKTMENTWHVVWWHARNIKHMSLRYFHGLNIFIVLDTCVRQNGHRDTELEHLLHRTWPHGINVMFTSEFRHTRHDHADLATSASLTADSAFSYNSSSNSFQCDKQAYAKEEQFS